MKLVYFGYDVFWPCLAATLELGHEVLAIYSGAPSVHTTVIHRLAEQAQIPVHTDKPSNDSMATLVEAGASLFFCAEYPFRIPLPSELQQAINLHPTLLPHGRGPTPIPWLLLQHAEHAGISFHQMTERFDAGKVLLQQAISLNGTENYDDYVQAAAACARRLMPTLLNQLDALSASAQAQHEGSDWPAISRAQQTIDWRQTVAHILRQVRAFGSLGTYATLHELPLQVLRADGVVQTHGAEPGTILSADACRIKVAVADGWITLAPEDLRRLA